VVGCYPPAQSGGLGIAGCSTRDWFANFLVFSFAIGIMANNGILFLFRGMIYRNITVNIIEPKAICSVFNPNLNAPFDALPVVWFIFLPSFIQEKSFRELSW
jgi:hypothetical protein